MNKMTCIECRYFSMKMETIIRCINAVSEEVFKV